MKPCTCFSISGLFDPEICSLILVSRRVFIAVKLSNLSNGASREVNIGDRYSSKDLCKKAVLSENDKL